MLQPESLVKLIGSGNTRSVEEEWMQVVESADSALPKLAEYAAVLTKLRECDRASQAEALAWAAIETISGRNSPEDTLTVAGPFLLAVGNADELRQQVGKLYRSAYADREGLDALMSEARIEGGRPVRRALRTLQVCLNLSEGDYLVARYGGGAARIDQLDKTSWDFTITGPDGKETLGAVNLADQYMPGSAGDFAVMRQFESEKLAKRLQKDPASIVMDLCKAQDGKINSDEIQSELVPNLLTGDEWKKWWTRARGALKRHSNVKLEGRSPYVVTYVDEPLTLEESLLQEFGEVADPLDRLGVLGRYLRECKSRKESVSNEAIASCCENLRQRAQTLTDEGAQRAGLVWVIACQAARLCGLEERLDGAADFFGTVSDWGYILTAIESEGLMDVACDRLAEARPDDWQEQLLRLLPVLKLVTCDRAAVRLAQAGRTLADFEPVVQRIVASPAAHFEALLWLWHGPTNEADIVAASPVMILMRIMRALEDSRRSDDQDRETMKNMGIRTRAILSARKFGRFASCLDELDAGMAVALRTQLIRTEALGRAVREDMLGSLGRKFPALDEKPEIKPWAREDAIFVTAEGMSTKQREIEHHVNVKMKENAVAIGDAAERGDLSENSEYKFALEERDLLRARLAQMNAEMEKAVVMSTEDVPVDHIGIGTRAVFRRVSDGEQYEISFLGPWEADADQGRMNYLAPLAQKLMAKRIGEKVEFDLMSAVGEYELMELHNSLDE